MPKQNSLTFKAGEGTGDRAFAASSTSEQQFVSLANGSSGDIEIERAFLAVQSQIYDVFCRKQRDYGRGNIAKFGLTGVMVRVSDKAERLINLWRRKRRATNESIFDTWQDIACYGIIGLMCLINKWPGAFSEDETAYPTSD